MTYFAISSFKADRKKHSPKKISDLHKQIGKYFSIRTSITVKQDFNTKISHRYKFITKINSRTNNVSHVAKNINEKQKSRFTGNFRDNSDRTKLRQYDVLSSYSEKPQSATGIRQHHEIRQHLEIRYHEIR